MFELSPDLIKIDRTKNKQWLAWQHTTNGMGMFTTYY